MAGLLDGRVTIVTGAASGIGRATASLMGREGARLVLADQSPEGEAVAAEICARGGDAVFATTDIADPVQVEALVAMAMSRFGRLDCAFNNAGIGYGPCALADIDIEAWRRMIDIDLSGAFYCLKYEIPAMLASGAGAIVNTASTAGLVGMRTMAAYVAAKHGVVGLTRAAALEYASRDVRVNALCPGPVDTEPMRAAGITIKTPNPQIPPVPLGRFGQPEEMAELVVWLLSDHASFMTGQAIANDGGVMAGGIWEY